MSDKEGKSANYWDVTACNRSRSTLTFRKNPLLSSCVLKRSNANNYEEAGSKQLSFTPQKFALVTVAVATTYSFRFDLGLLSSAHTKLPNQY